MLDSCATATKGYGKLLRNVWRTKMYNKGYLI